MLQDMWNAPPGFRPSKSAPSSPAKPIGMSRTRSESFHAIHKVPVGDSPYVRAKNVQLVEKDPEKAIPLFWAAINAGDRVDSALKDMAIVMKQQNRAEEAIEAIKSLRSRCSDQAQESLDNILLDLYKRCGRLDDQIALLRHKLYLIQQGLAFNGKRTKTARSQGKKFQVSVEQEATRLLGNLGWALMQQNNYLEAEDAYRRALSIAPDNNKMCNLGICLMKQGRITEAKETLRRVKPAVADGPRGVDSHLKAYERAQQMLKDLESEMLNRGGDRVEQSRLFDAFLGSSSIWQPQPCRDHTVLPTSNATKSYDDFADENVDSNTITNHLVPPLHQHKNVASKQVAVPYVNSVLSTAATNALISKNLLKDDFADENINMTTSNTIANQQVVLPQQRLVKPVAPFGNSWNVAAPPFYSSKFAKEPIGNQYNESLKRTRSGNATNSMRVDISEPHSKPVAVVEPEKPETKTRRRLSLTSDEKNKSTEFLPNDEDFEEAILAAVLGSTTSEAEKKKAETSSETSEVFQMKIDKRLKVFQDITLSLSPRA